MASRRPAVPSHPPPPPPPPFPLLGIEDVLCAAQVDMKKGHAAEDARLKTCWSTLLKYIGNVAQARAPGCHGHV